MKKRDGRVFPPPLPRASTMLSLWDRRCLWHPFTQHDEWDAREPVIIKSGRGVWLRDVRGRRFIDGVSSLWVNVFGHRRPELDAALRRQLARHAHSTFLGLSHEPAIRLARELVRIAPPRLARVFYSDNGSTAVEVALKMAYQYWQLRGAPRKTKFVSLRDGYHGDTIGSVSVGGIDLFHARYRGLLFKGWQVEPPREGGGRPAEGGRKMRSSAFDSILRDHHPSIAAVVMEPLIQGASGMRLIAPGFLKHAETLCRRFGVLLIVDEIATGFGRTGTMFAVEREKVEPDFLCVAKSLTGGYLPLAATLATESVFRAFRGRYDAYRHFFHGHTYTANPLACAVAVANLELYRKTDLLANVRERARQLAEGLAPLAGHPHVREVRQVGLMAGIELVKDKERSVAYAPGARMGLKACDEAFRRGVWLRPLGDVVIVMPPLAINRADMGYLIRAVRGGIEAACASHSR